MSVQTMTLADFLLARIAADEAVANLSVSHGTGNFPTAYWQRLWNGPGQYPVMAAQRLLAECEAKRRIVEAYTDMEALGGTERIEQRMTLRWTMELLALPYADHPDYDESWRP